MLGMDLADLLTGLALVEYIFGWPGIGWQALQAAQRFDVPMIMGSVLFGALLIGLANLVVDLIYGWLDPRVRLGEAGGGRVVRSPAVDLFCRLPPPASLFDPGSLEERPATDQAVQRVVVDVLAAEGDRFFVAETDHCDVGVDRQLLDFAVGGDALGVGLGQGFGGQNQLIDPLVAIAPSLKPVSTAAQVIQPETKS